MLALWGLLGGGLWGLLARQVHSALSDMVLAADLAAFWGVAGTILALAALEGLLVFSGRTDEETKELYDALLTHVDAA